MHVCNIFWLNNNFVQFPISKRVIQLHWFVQADSAEKKIIHWNSKGSLNEIFGRKWLSPSSSSVLPYFYFSSSIYLNCLPFSAPSTVKTYKIIMTLLYKKNCTCLFSLHWVLLLPNWLSRHKKKLILCKKRRASYQISSV